MDYEVDGAAGPGSTQDDGFPVSATIRAIWKKRGWLAVWLLCSAYGLVMTVAGAAALAFLLLLVTDGPSWAGWTVFVLALILAFASGGLGGYAWVRFAELSDEQAAARAEAARLARLRRSEVGFGD